MPLDERWAEGYKAGLKSLDPILESGGWLAESPLPTNPYDPNDLAFQGWEEAFYDLTSAASSRMSQPA